MNDLEKLSISFSKLAEDNYDDNERTKALIGNLKMVHHQIKNSGLINDPAKEEHILAALHKIVGAIRDLEAITATP